MIRALPLDLCKPQDCQRSGDHGLRSQIYFKPLFNSKHGLLQAWTTLQMVGAACICC